MAAHQEGLSRRAFVQRGSKAAAGMMAGALVAPRLLRAEAADAGARMRFGLVTYQWGRDWNLPTLLRNCERAGALGVELRVEHAHGVEPHLNERQRAEVRLRFENSPVELVGFGTNWAFHYPDPIRLWQEIDGAKEHIVLSHDVGGSGVKVKPNALPAGVPVEKTIEQIGQSLNHLGRFAADYGQEIRVEVHGQGTQQLPTMRRIFDVVEEPNVRVNWNCNPQDLDGQGLEYNFNLVRDDLGATVHVREFNVGDYPYPQLIRLLVEMDYDGWILMEARTEPADRVQALIEQRALFEEMVARAQAAG
ncbi:MAG: sugar phosphate isomerase/epimerase [Bacteroidetes bacterium]|nr:MAG: sugar phosphate isomerase/epimerase [Bacteroidota bacterium]